MTLENDGKTLYSHVPFADDFADTFGPIINDHFLFPKAQAEDRVEESQICSPGTMKKSNIELLDT